MIRALALPLFLAAALLAGPSAAGAATSGAGPKLTLAPKGSAAGRIATLTVTNPNAFALHGSLALKLDGVRVAGAKLNLAAKARRSLQLRLGDRAARVLQGDGRVALRAVATVSGPTGRARTTSAGVTLTVAKKQPGTVGDGPAVPDAGPDGTYRGDSGLTIAVSGGKVTAFSGSITTFCTETQRQKSVSFGMYGDDPQPSVAADGSFAWEATENYGFVKLKFSGRIVGSTASGNFMVEDRSPMSTSDGKLAFDYCFAGRDWTASR